MPFLFSFHCRPATARHKYVHTVIIGLEACSVGHVINVAVGGWRQKERKKKRKRKKGHLLESAGCGLKRGGELTSPG